MPVRTTKEIQMLRRVGAHGSAGRAPLGEDLGLFRGSFDGTGTAPQSALLNDPWSNGRTLALTGGEVRVRIPAGQPRNSGTVAALTAPAPDRNSGIWPLSRDRSYIALPGDPFNCGIWPHECPTS